MFKLTLNSLMKRQESTERCSQLMDFPGGSVVKNLSANAGDTGSILDLGRSHMPQSS